MTETEAIKLSLIIPVHNEAAGLQKLIGSIESVLDMSEHQYEIIIVDDGSDDTTWETLGGISTSHNHVKAIRFTRNFGKEPAIQAGLQLAGGRAAIVMDADLQHPPGLIPRMLSIWEKEGCDVVEGIKTVRPKESVIHRYGSTSFYRILSVVTGFDMEKNTDFKLLDRRVIDYYLSLGEKSRFFRALIPFLGFKTVQVPFSPNERTSGQTKFSLSRLFNLAISTITSFSSMPLHFVTILGILTLIFSFIVGTHTIYMKFSGQAVGGFTTVIMVLLMIGSILMIALGIIGEYIAKIFEEIKNRPTYIINETLNCESRGDGDR